jgi:hypothetical protein
MQGMTHFAVGILGYSIYRYVHYSMTKPNPKNISAVIKDSETVTEQITRIFIALVILALVMFSHVLLDSLALATYHPPNALLDSGFWLGFHALVALLTIYLAWKYRGIWLFLLASIVPDSDWIARPFGWWSEGAVHAYFRNLPVLAELDTFLASHLPDWRMSPLASINELLLLTLLMIFSSVFVRIYAHGNVKG